MFFSHLTDVGAAAIDFAEKDKHWDESAQSLFNDEWENFAAQAGMVATIGPVGDTFTAEYFSKRSGNTTMLQYGFNLGDDESSGDETNTGTGTSGMNVSANQGSGRNWGRNTSGGISYQQIERRAFLRRLRPHVAAGHGNQQHSLLRSQLLEIPQRAVGAARAAQSLPDRLTVMDWLK